MNERNSSTERRRYQRRELEVEVMVRTESALLPGWTHEISEAGLSAILPVELREGEKVQLQIKLPTATTTTDAVVRDRNVFRHGFEFLHPLRELVSRQVDSGVCQTCGGIGYVVQSLFRAEGVAFIHLTCTVCSGTGRTSHEV